jgi:hypothetical protein
VRGKEPDSSDAPPGKTASRTLAEIQSLVQRARAIGLIGTRGVLEMPSLVTE